MQRIDGRLVLSPTDLTKHVACPHITTLDLEALDAGTLRTAEVDDSLNLVFAKGLEHEREYLARLRAEGLVVEDVAARGLSGARAEEATVEAMERGVDVVYQATFFDGHWIGLADFLLRVDLPEGRGSRFGPYRYDIADTKLARRLKVPALLQMATYAARLEQLQGVPPQWLTVVTGDKGEHPWRLVDVAAYARRRREQLVEAIESRLPTEPVRVAQCAQCRWKKRCEGEWEAADDLVRVAGMRADLRAKLVAAGITTLRALATAPAERVDAALAGTSASTRERVRVQARLQLAERETGRPQYELLDPEPGQGLQLLPEPDAGDVYLDFEGDPWAEGGAGREYLAGIWTREGEFVEFWAHDFAAEGRLTTDLLDWLVRRWEQYPGMHVYHYAPYETTALKRLTGLHATREHELDQLLRGERFVDLYAVVRRGLRIGKGSYSIKKLEDFYWGHVRTGDAQGVSDGLSSVVEYERWLVGRDEGRADDTILEDIRRYNRDDVRSTLGLHEWLEERRAELAARFGVPLSRPGATPVEDPPEAALAEVALAERLLAVATPEATLLAGCVGWHRREERPAWWDFFRFKDAPPDELVESSTAVGMLGPPERTGEVKQSWVWRYRFPPQECGLEPGQRAHDVDAWSGVGEVVGIDPVAGWVDLKVGKRTPAPTPRGLMPPGPINTQVLRDSIARTAETYLSGGTTLATRLVRAEVPSPDLLRARPGETPAEVVVRVGGHLTGEVLAVQGPPGAGKTYAGAHLVRALLDRGLRVGVTALSHAVIRNLLDKVGRPALHKGGRDEGGGPGDEGATTVRVATTNDEVVAALASGEANLVGGTAWLWAREELAEAVDVLVIDEAGQFSLANAVAVAQAARSLVLLGDPQQLQQPTQAVHPHGAGVSVLDHLIAGHDVIPADRGVFLDRTYRMHPGLTAFVSELAYEGRLGSAEGRERLGVDAPGRLSGSGLRWVPVQHEDVHDQTGPEETAVVAELVDDLLRGRWVDAEGEDREMSAADVLVVAPYNAHVAALRDALPPAVPVGTVDKFQGQEGAVVIYAMGSTDARSAPRGVGFLYDVHRLNVAVSRARAIAVVVGSPALLDAAVHTPEELRAVNALCRLVEEAKTV